VEELELEELPGAQGLRALRVTVDLTGRNADPRAPRAGFDLAAPGAASSPRPLETSAGSPDASAATL
jgi:hypothetical protein